MIPKKRPNPRDFKGDFSGGKSLEAFEDGNGDKMQPISHRLLTRAPLATEMAEREIVLAIVGSDYRLYVKINGELYYETLTLAT